MSGQGWQGGGPRLTELERYCDRRFDQRESLEGLREKIAGIPPDAVRYSNFFHCACANERVTLEMIECLLGAFPAAVRWTDSDGDSPLHCACQNKKPDPGIVRVLLERWPDAVNHRNVIGGRLPLHWLCESSSVDETASLAVLELLLAAAPQSVEEFDDDGALPIHIASRRGRSYPFCQRLIDANPESLRVQGGGYLPIHLACWGGDIETVMYIVELYPESIGARDSVGDLPMNYAVESEPRGKDKADIITYLLTNDPDCASKRNSRQNLPLHLAVHRNCLDSVRLLFDAYPEAITIGVPGLGTPLDVARGREKDALVEFLEDQLVYADLVEDTTAMTTPDENGWLPLHHALRSDASLGAIKLLISGNLSALRVAGNGLAFPLHIACEFSTVSVVQHLLGLLDIHLHTLDLQRDSTLHYACRGGNVGIAKCLLDRGVPAVSEPDSDGKLPIHLLWESDRVDRDSVEYVDAVWRLLLAHPGMMTL